MTNTRAAAQTWLIDRDGREVETVQRRPDGTTWEPGPRTVEVTGSRVRLDGSRVQLTPDHVVHAVTDDRLTVEWLDGDGVQIHVTTYRDIPEVEDESDDSDDDGGPCRECGESTADGEGYDGLCGTCADRAEQPSQG